MGGYEGKDVGVGRAVSSCFLCVLCDDDEVGLYVCKYFFILRIVLSCRGLNVGRWFCTACCSCGESVALVWGYLGLR